MKRVFLDGLCQDWISWLWYMDCSGMGFMGWDFGGFWTLLGEGLDS